MKRHLPFHTFQNILLYVIYSRCPQENITVLSCAILSTLLYHTSSTMKLLSESDIKPEFFDKVNAGCHLKYVAFKVQQSIQFMETTCSSIYSQGPTMPGDERSIDFSVNNTAGMPAFSFYIEFSTFFSWDQYFLLSANDVHSLLSLWDSEKQLIYNQTLN